ncbi:uncharacterized protein VTP21DRAFT_959 [Calcarisporiella thermophila]|uniref:uncharacterized protein n=1 Tax=Calcarisporiella thermophila TaxID=911321 RepID=UPI0037420AEF
MYSLPIGNYIVTFASKDVLISIAILVVWLLIRPYIVKLEERGSRKQEEMAKKMLDSGSADAKDEAGESSHTGREKEGTKEEEEKKVQSLVSYAAT